MTQEEFLLVNFRQNFIEYFYRVFGGIVNRGLGLNKEDGDGKFLESTLKVASAVSITAATGALSLSAALVPLSEYAGMAPAAFSRSHEESEIKKANPKSLETVDFFGVIEQSSYEISRIYEQQINFVKEEDLPKLAIFSVYKIINYALKIKTQDNKLFYSDFTLENIIKEFAIQTDITLSILFNKLISEFLPSRLCSTCKKVVTLSGALLDIEGLFANSALRQIDDDGNCEYKSRYESKDSNVSNLKYGFRSPFILRPSELDNRYKNPVDITLPYQEALSILCTPEENKKLEDHVETVKQYLPIHREALISEISDAITSTQNRYSSTSEYYINFRESLSNLKPQKYQTNTNPVLTSIDLNNIGLRNLNVIEHIIFENCYMVGVKIANLELRHCSFKNVPLVGAIFRDICFFDCIFKNSNVSFSIFENVNIQQDQSMDETPKPKITIDDIVSIRGSKFINTNKSTFESFGIKLDEIPGIFSVNGDMTIMTMNESELEKQLNLARQSKLKQQLDQLKQEFDQTNQQVDQNKQQIEQNKHKLQIHEDRFDQTNQQIEQLKKEVYLNKQKISQIGSNSKISLCSNIPFSENFAGIMVEMHEELEALDNLVADNKIVVIHGMSGVGKTSLVTKYAHNHLSQEGSNHIYYIIDSENSEKIKSGFASMLQDESISNFNQDALIRKLISCFNDQSKAITIILDKLAKIDDQGEDGIAKYFLLTTECSEVRFIITTTDSGFMSPYGNSQLSIGTLKLDPLTREEAINHVKKHITKPGLIMPHQVDEMESLYQAMIGIFSDASRDDSNKNRIITAKSLKVKLMEVINALAHHIEISEIIETLKTMDENLLNHIEQNSNEWKVIKYLSYLNSGTEIDCQLLINISSMKTKDFMEAIFKLKQSSLLNYYQERFTVLIHYVIETECMNRLKKIYNTPQPKVSAIESSNIDDDRIIDPIKTTKTNETIFNNDIINRLVAYFDQAFKNVGASFDDKFPNMTKGRDFYKEATKLVPFVTKLSKLLIDYDGKSYDGKGYDGNPAHISSKDIDDLLDKISKENVIHLISFLRKIGAYHYSVLSDETKASDYYKKSHELTIRTQAKYPLDISEYEIALSHMYHAVSYIIKNEYEKAINTYKIAIEQSKKLLDQDPNNIELLKLCYDNYLSYGVASRDSGKSSEVIGKIISFSQELMQKKGFENQRASLCCLVSSMYKDLGEKGQMDEWARSSLEIREGLKLRGEEVSNLDLSESYYIMALSLAEQSQLQEAETRINEAIRLLKQQYENHPSLSYCFSKLGMIYRKQGKYQEAIKQVKDAYEILSKYEESGQIRKTIEIHSEFEFARTLLKKSGQDYEGTSDLGFEKLKKYNERGSFYEQIINSAIAQNSLLMQDSYNDESALITSSINTLQVLGMQNPLGSIGETGEESI
ncbi:MAG: tetratricopeptide repeat protein [Rickettsiaceae bacterium]|nr:tetratricopeptide repeat protein [Rickettsiaceae bacterium]